jgi:hypothetical protein
MTAGYSIRNSTSSRLRRFVLTRQKKVNWIMFGGNMLYLLYCHRRLENRKENLLEKK